MTDDLATLGDGDLVLLAQAGSTAAFAALHDRHAPGVGRALASFAGPDRHLLDDLVQDVFLRVIEGLPSYAPRRPFAHWLYTVALNVGRNHARRPARVVTVDPADLAELAGSGAPGADPALAAALMRAVAALPLPLREVVSLRVGADLSYAEIAEILAVPEGTARRRMHDALAALRERLGTTAPRRHRDG